MSSTPKIAFVCVALACVAVVLWMANTRQRDALITYTYSQFLDQVHSGQVASVTVMGSNSGAIEATYRLKGGEFARTVLPSDYKDALRAMQDKLVNIEIRDSSSEPRRLLVNAAPFLPFLGGWIILMIRKFPGSFKPTLLG